MGKLRHLLAFGALAGSLLGGCGDVATRAQVADLRRRLDDQQQRAAAAEHKIDDLENRVFLLTDQVESQKVAAVHRDRPRLPVVTLQPTPAEPAAAAAPSPSSSSNAADVSDEVAFEGAASSSDPDHARPLLRVDGPQPIVHRLHEKKLPRIASAAPLPSEHENLGVAPAPPVPVAVRAPTPVAPGEARRALLVEGGREGPPPMERSAPAVEPLTLYRSAYEALRAGHHEVAERGFREFVRRFPRHDYADNAQYWLGECFYDQKRFDTAAAEFRAVVQRWPTGNKAPDAMLKLGYSLLALGQVDKARVTLHEVPATYPRTEAARLASERLAQLTPTEARK